MQKSLQQECCFGKRTNPRVGTEFHPVEDDLQRGFIMTFLHGVESKILVWKRTQKNYHKPGWSGAARPKYIFPKELDTILNCHHQIGVRDMGADISQVGRLWYAVEIWLGGYQVLEKYQRHVGDRWGDG